MKKVIICLSCICLSIASYGQEFVSYSRDNVVKVKGGNLGAQGTGTVIGVEGDFVFILTAAHVAHPGNTEPAIIVSVKNNRWDAKKNNSPEFSVINAIPVAKDEKLDVAVIKVHKAFLPDTYIKSADMGFSNIPLSKDTTGFSTKTFSFTGFAGDEEIYNTKDISFGAHNFSSDKNYFELKGEGNRAGYAGSVVYTGGKAVAILLTDGEDTKVKALKPDALIAYLKKNNIPANFLIAGGK